MWKTHNKQYQNVDRYSSYEHWGWGAGARGLSDRYMQHAATLPCIVGAALRVCKELGGPLRVPLLNLDAVKRARTMGACAGVCERSPAMK